MEYTVATIVDMELKAAAIPFLSVSEANGVPAIRWAPETTPEQIIQGNALVASLDLTTQGQRAWAFAQVKKRAKEMLLDQQAAELVRRVSDQVLLAILKDTRDALIPPKVTPTWAQYQQTVRDRIDDLTS